MASLSVSLTYIDHRKSQMTLEQRVTAYTRHVLFQENKEETRENYGRSDAYWDGITMNYNN